MTFRQGESPVDLKTSRKGLNLGRVDNTHRAKGIRGRISMSSLSDVRSLAESLQSRESLSISL